MKRKLLWISSAMMIVIVLIAILFPLAKPMFSSASVLTEEEAKKIAVERYAGTISSIEKQADEYVIKIKRKTGLYELKLNASTGEVASLKKIEESSHDKTAKEKVDVPKSELSEEDIQAIVNKKQKGEIVSIERKTDAENDVYVVGLSDGDGNTTLTIDAVSGLVLKEERESVKQLDIKLTEQEASAIALTQTGGGEVEAIWMKDVNGMAHYVVEIENGDDDYMIEINSITGVVKSIARDDDDDDVDDDDDD